MQQTVIIELKYDVRTALGHRFSNNVLRAWPQGVAIADVMAKLMAELQSLGCQDITVTRAANGTSPEIIMQREETK